jgi:hypothetical protein
VDEALTCDDDGAGAGNDLEGKLQYLNRQSRKSMELPNISKANDVQITASVESVINSLSIKTL